MIVNERSEDSNNRVSRADRNQSEPCPSVAGERGEFQRGPAFKQHQQRISNCLTEKYSFSTRLMVNSTHTSAVSAIAWRTTVREGHLHVDSNGNETVYTGKDGPIHHPSFPSSDRSSRRERVREK